MRKHGPTEPRQFFSAFLPGVTGGVLQDEEACFDDSRVVFRNVVRTVTPLRATETGMVRDPADTSRVESPVHAATQGLGPRSDGFADDERQ